jgi:CRP/FNR family transcriptional regulator, cyclic AMP receptor protein
VILGERERELLLRHAVIRRYPRGRLLFRRGDDGHSLFLVIDGEVEIFLGEDQERTLIARMHAGEVFGELSLMGDCRRTASAITVAKSSLAIVTRSEFQSRLAESGELRAAVLQHLVRLADALTVRVSTVQMGAYGRLRSCLCALAGSTDKGCAIPGIWTQQSLAEWTGCTRETVAKIMGQLRRGGWVRYNRGRIVIVRCLPTTF